MKEILRQNQLFFFLFLLWMVAGALLMAIYHSGFFVLYFALERSDQIDNIALVITKFGEIIAYIIVLIILLFIRFRYALILPLIGGSVFLLSYTLKRFFGHPRPRVLFWRQVDSGGLELPDFYLNLGWNSFPSGHTMSAFALYGFLALAVANKRWGPVFFFIALGVGITRIMLTQHFLEDIYLGSILGLLVAVTFYAIQAKRPINPETWYDRSLINRKRS